MKTLKQYIPILLALALVVGAFFYQLHRIQNGLRELQSEIQEMQEARSETDEQIVQIELSQQEFRKAIRQADKAAKERVVTIREDIKKQVALISDDAIGRAIDAELAIFESRSLGEGTPGVDGD